MMVSCSQTIISKYMSFANVALNKYDTAVLLLYTQTNTPPPPLNYAVYCQYPGEEGTSISKQNVLGPTLSYC